MVIDAAAGFNDIAVEDIRDVGTPASRMAGRPVISFQLPSPLRDEVNGNVIAEHLMGTGHELPGLQIASSSEQR